MQLKVTILLKLYTVESNRSMCVESDVYYKPFIIKSPEIRTGQSL